MEKSAKEQMDLPFGERRPKPTQTDSTNAGTKVTSLTARIEATRSAERRELYRAIISRAAHLLSSDDQNSDQKQD